MGRQPIIRTPPIGRESESEGTAIHGSSVPRRRSSLLQFRRASSGGRRVPVLSDRFLGSALRAA